MKKLNSRERYIVVTQCASCDYWKNKVGCQNANRLSVQPLDNCASYTGIKCSECQGKTIFFSGKGLDMQYKLCSQWQTPGHKTEDEVKDEITRERQVACPSGRTA